MANEAFLCEDNVQNLVENVIDNCKIVEELSMVEINSRHIPLINSTLCLTNADCKIILDKCKHHCHNVLETSVLLIALTDFISCVSANSETFPMGSGKKGSRKITVLLHALTSNWMHFFAKLSAEDMSISQLTGIANIVKRCLERIPPERTYKMYMEKILKMTNKALQALLKPPKVKGIHENAEKSMSGEITPSKLSSFANANKSLESVSQTSDSSQVVQRKENKGNVKQSYDITKFILKPCENMIREKTNERSEKNVGCKRKFHDIESEQAILGSEQIEKGPAEHPEVDEAPPAKKHCVHDDFINGKVNAFKMLMKPRKTNSQLKQSNSLRH